MINKKYAQPLFMILMSLGMSVIMSGVVVAVNTGVSDFRTSSSKLLSVIFCTVLTNVSSYYYICK